MTTSDHELASLAAMAEAATPASSTSPGAVFLRAVAAATTKAMDGCGVLTYDDATYDYFLHADIWMAVEEAMGGGYDEGSFASYIDLKLILGSIAEEATEVGFPGDTGFCLSRAAYNLAAKLTLQRWSV